MTFIIAPGTEGIIDIFTINPAVRRETGIMISTDSYHVWAHITGSL